MRIWHCFWSKPVSICHKMNVSVVKAIHWGENKIRLHVNCIKEMHYTCHITCMLNKSHNRNTWLRLWKWQNNFFWKVVLKKYMFWSNYLHPGSLLQFVQPDNSLSLKHNMKMHCRKIMMWVSISAVHVLKVKHHILDK